eukprot:15317087-Alexandrium_andersonii.AAC.1
MHSAASAVDAATSPVASRFWGRSLDERHRGRPPRTRSARTARHASALASAGPLKRTLAASS